MKSFITTERSIHCHHEPALILLPLWSHSIHGLQFYCAHTVQSDVSFMLGCEQKNLLTFTFGCCAGEINVKHTHTHTHKVVLFMYEMKNWIQMVSDMSLIQHIWRIHLKDMYWSKSVTSENLVAACVLKMCRIKCSILSKFFFYFWSHNV